MKFIRLDDTIINIEEIATITIRKLQNAVIVKDRDQLISINLKGSTDRVDVFTTYDKAVIFFKHIGLSCEILSEE